MPSDLSAFFTNILNHTADIGPFKERIHRYDKMLLCRRAFDGHLYVQNYVLKISTIRTARKDTACSIANAALKFILNFTIETIMEMRRTMLLPFFCEATLFERFCFRDWMAVLSLDAPQLQKSLISFDSCGSLKVMQRLKPFPFI